MSLSSKIVAITGATASGKTKLALDLAVELHGEIINADSVQVYEELDIGSAKPSLAEQNLVKHHLLSYLNPKEVYSAGRFRKDCLEVIKELQKNNIPPIIAGGSGLYLSSLFSGFFDDSWFMSDTHDFLSKVKESKTPEDYSIWSQMLLKILDPLSDLSLSPNDHFRRERALYLSLSIGAPASELKSTLTESGESLGGLIIILERERKDLYQRIDSRVNSMMKDGLLYEVKNILDLYGENCPSLKAIGYSQVVEYLAKEKQGVTPVVEDLIKIIQRDTRRFAKRQLTWWRNQPSKLGWIDVLKLPVFESVVSEFLNLNIPTGEKVVSENQGFQFSISDTTIKTVDGALEGSYSELKSFLKCLIARYESDDLGRRGDVSAVSNSFISNSKCNKDRSDLVYMCRVRCLD